MHSRIWTAIKLLLPWWATSVAVSGLAVVVTPANETSDYPLLCLGLGCALLAARAFSRALPQDETDTPPSERAWIVRIFAVSVTALAAAAAFTWASVESHVSPGLPIPLLAVLTVTPALGIVPYLTMRIGKPFAAV